MLELTLNAKIDLTMSDAHHGRGLFETIRIQDGRACWLYLHLERMASGCAYLGMSTPPGAEALSRFLAANTDIGNMATGTLRMIALDGKLIVTPGPAPTPVTAPAKLAISDCVRRLSSSPLCRFKTLSYLENCLMHSEAEARCLFDVVALNERGDLTDGGRTNLFIMLRGKPLTPPEEDGALPGIGRKILLLSDMAEASSVSPEDLEQAEGVFLVNALRGVIPVRQDPSGWVEKCAQILS